MLQELELINFQGHVHSYFAFHHHLNVIRGTSNHGKSSIIRAILWASENEPYGIDYRNWYADEKAGVEAHLSFSPGSNLDDNPNVVSRIKNSKLNGYLLTTSSVTDDKFEALRSDVPIEVRATTRLSRTNIRGQDDGYFMLQDSPGTVARMLNEKTGLNDIDKVNTISKSLLREYSDRLSFTKEELKLNKEREKYLLRIKTFENKIKELDNFYKERDQVEGKQNQLEQILSTIFDIDSMITVCEKVFERQQDLDILSNLLARRLKLESQHTRLKTSLHDINMLETKIEHILIEMERAPLINELNLLIIERQEMMKKYSHLQAFRSIILKLDSRIHILESDIDQLKSALEIKREELNSINICPTCGADKEYWKHEIKEM